jgi:cyclase
VIGTDAFSLDVPFEVMKDQFAATRDPAIIWPAHFAGHKLPYCQIEKLTNLDKLPAQGFFVACFPVKISRASAGWTRAVALVP